jgi:hypothetical protein
MVHRVNISGPKKVMIFRAHPLLGALQNRSVDGNPGSCPLSRYDGSYLPPPTHPLFKSFFSLFRDRGLSKREGVGSFLTAEKVFILLYCTSPVKTIPLRSIE